MLVAEYHDVARGRGLDDVPASVVQLECVGGVEVALGELGGPRQLALAAEGRPTTRSRSAVASAILVAERMDGLLVRRERAAILLGAPRGCSSMAEHQLPKLTVRVRFPSPAPPRTPRSESQPGRAGPRSHPGSATLVPAPCPKRHDGPSAVRSTARALRRAEAIPPPDSTVGRRQGDVPHRGHVGTQHGTSSPCPTAGIGLRRRLGRTRCGPHTGKDSSPAIMCREAPNRSLCTSSAGGATPAPTKGHLAMPQCTTTSPTAASGTPACRRKAISGRRYPAAGRPRSCTVRQLRHSTVRHSAFFGLSNKPGLDILRKACSPSLARATMRRRASSSVSRIFRFTT